MEIFFTGKESGRPFILDSLMRWVIAVNHFLRDVSVIDGKTVSPLTWRAYAYHLLDFLNYCERVGLDWTEVSELHLAEYRNALVGTVSPLTQRFLTRKTVNGRLGTVCRFYKFALREGYVSKLPFSYKDVRVSRNHDEDMMAHAFSHSGKIEANRLMLRTYDGELEIPSNKDIGRFISNFSKWRDKLIAEVMWFTGMRRDEACKLTVHALPEDPLSLAGRTHKVRIQGKGGKGRSVYWPAGLLASISRYIELERNPRVRKHKVKTDRIWVSDKGQPINSAAIDKIFATNSARCGVKVAPHDLRRSYATNRLIYLEDHDVPSPYKIVQGELGHANLSTTLRYIYYVERMRVEVVTSHGHFISQLTDNIKEDDDEEES